MSAQQIDEKKLERAIRKIKHCLALAQSANENEAATALRQAQALMREYRLTEMDEAERCRRSRVAILPG